MLKVKLTTSFPQWPLAQQTPGRLGIWEDVQFYINQPIDRCDAWVVYDGLPAEESAWCPPNHVIYVASEPPAYKRYSPRWLSQFERVISCQRRIRHPRVYRSQPGLPWLIERSYDQLTQQNLPSKSREVSAICSNKRTTRGHARRLDFVKALENRTRMDLFGRGLNPLQEKWEGLAPYRYSVAIENSLYPDYWTEKVADCFLADVIPLYHGCPNLTDYFPSEAFICIDLHNLDQTSTLIQDQLGPVDYRRRQPALAEARRLVLDQYNLFKLLRDDCIRLPFDRAPRRITLRPEPPLPYWHRKWEQWRRKWFG